MLQAFLKTHDDEDEEEKSEEGHEKLSRLALCTLEIIKALLAAGADVDVMNKQGETPLFALLGSPLIVPSNTNPLH